MALIRLRFGVLRRGHPNNTKLGLAPRRAAAASEQRTLYPPLPGRTPVGGGRAGIRPGRRAASARRGGTRG